MRCSDGSREQHEQLEERFAAKILMGTSCNITNVPSETSKKVLLGQKTLSIFPGAKNISKLLIQKYFMINGCIESVNQIALYSFQFKCYESVPK
jgi:hypothetical protein